MLKHEDVTGAIIKAFYKVYNTLGFGFLERVYENAMLVELRRQGLDVRAQLPVTVYYEDEPVGHYYADLMVNGVVIVELKAASDLNADHCKQLVNYLKATHLEVGLVLNFGPKPEFERRIYDTARRTPELPEP